MHSTASAGEGARNTFDAEPAIVRYSKDAVVGTTVRGRVDAHHARVCGRTAYDAGFADDTIPIGRDAFKADGLVRDGRRALGGIRCVARTGDGSGSDIVAEGADISLRGVRAVADDGDGTGAAADSTHDAERVERRRTVVLDVEEWSGTVPNDGRGLRLRAEEPGSRAHLRGIRDTRGGER